MDTKKAFAARLMQLRKEKDITQAALADAVGISRQSVTLYEGEARLPDIDVLARMAVFFGVTTDYLTGLTDARTHEAADICERTGLSERAVRILEVQQKKQKIALTDAVILSDIIENSVPPLTFTEYLRGAICIPVFSDTGEDLGFLSVSDTKNEVDVLCTFYRRNELEDDDMIHFPPSDFETEESLPLSFRRSVMEEYAEYAALAKGGSSLDVLRILREFYETAEVADAKLKYNRALGFGHIEQDMTSVLINSAEREGAETASDLLALMCDDSLSDVTTIPIAEMLDEITSEKLKAAFIQIRRVRRMLFDKEPPHAEEI